MEKIRIGVSACLLGEKVRYDGRDKYDSLIVDLLSQGVEFVPVCPEFELGLGVPREPIHLEGDPATPRLVTNETGRDLTESMQAWCRKRVRELEQEKLSGFIFKSKSPSCGMAVDEYRGLFAAAFINHFPQLPAEEAERLHDPALRDGFIERARTV